MFHLKFGAHCEAPVPSEGLANWSKSSKDHCCGWGWEEVRRGKPLGLCHFEKKGLRGIELQSSAFQGRVGKKVEPGFFQGCAAGE